jgi:hypothetical protein
MKAMSSASYLGCFIIIVINIRETGNRRIQEKSPLDPTDSGKALMRNGQLSRCATQWVVIKWMIIAS